MNPKNSSFAIALLFTLTSCREEFMHYRQDLPKKEEDRKYAVKELVGNQQVDIVWVIDNSGSMGPYQQQVKQNTNAFIAPFSKNTFKLDWKMGLISTDVRDGPYIGFSPTDLLNPTRAGIVGAFQSAVGRLGVNGDGCERAFSPIMKQLTQYPGFLRKNSMLALVFVTDAPEQSDTRNYNCPTSPTTYPMVQDFNKDLALKKGDKDLSQVVAYGIFGALDLGCQTNSSETPWNFKNSRYEQFLNSVGASKTYALCRDDFGNALAEIGKDLVKRVEQPKIFLSKRPILDSLRVFYKGNELIHGISGQGGFWSYDYRQNAIIFHDLSFATEDNASVDVQFDEDQSID
jgi:hypothetical protein